jgi:hypothetical protein
MANVSVVVPNEVLESMASILGQMIVINAAFSFSSDIVAQLLEGKRCCCETRKKERGSRAPTRVPTPTATTPTLKKIDEIPTDKPVEVVHDPTKPPATVEPAPPVAVPVAPATEPPAGTTPHPTEGTGVGEAGGAPVPPSGGDPAAPTDGALKELPEPFDWNRAFKFAFTGVIFCGVVQFVRLEIIDVIFPKNEGTTFTMAIYKTLFNQLIFSPVVRIASMSTIQYMKTRDCGDVKLKLQNDFFEAQAVSYAVKPVGNFLAFWIFPHNLVGQAVMIRSIAFIYNVYFSYKANREVHPEGELAAEGEEGCVTLKDAEEVQARKRTPDGAVDPTDPVKDGEAGGERPTPVEKGETKPAKPKDKCVCCVIS